MSASSRLTIESMLIQSGMRAIAGVDEAGRGPCAGPLLVAAVILDDPVADTWKDIRDSKELSEKKREELFDVIYHHARSVSVVEISPEEIDKRGVHAANLDGMRRAVQGLDHTPDYVVTDGYAIEGLAVPNVAVWKGDQVSVAIGAASIIAKVTRDRIMIELDKTYPEYGFAGHKGYITASHTAALKEHGVTPAHRTSFSNIAELL
jgi:ribonuclease HII